MDHEKIVKSSAPSKYLVHGWRVLLGRLPTRVALQQRGIVNFDPGPSCVQCFRFEESAERLFFTCSRSVQLWKLIEEWAGPQGGAFISCWQHFKSHGIIGCSKKQKKFRFIVWIAVVWVIWVNRNRIIFRGVVFNVQHLEHQVKALSWSWFSNRGGDSMHIVFSDWCS